MKRALLRKGLPALLHRYDEWYAFATNPRSKPGYHILITADEKGVTTPAALLWATITRWHGGIASERATHSIPALAHGGMMYAEPANHSKLYGNAMAWAAC